MITFIGVIVLLIGIALLCIRPFLNEVDKTGQRQTSRGMQEVILSKKSPDILLGINWKKSLAVITLGLMIICMPMIVFYAEPGQAYAVQFPNGKQKAVMSQGFKTKWFGRLIPIQQEIVIKDILPETVVENESEYAYLLKASEREFNDAVKGIVANSVVLSLDLTNDSTFLEVATKNRSERNLVYSRIIPFRDAVLKNTSKLMSAQDYIAGASSEYDQAYKDQLENGMYILEEVNADSQENTVGDKNVERTVSADGNDDSKRKEYRIKTHKVNGINVPLRNEGSLKDYGLKVVQAVVSKIDWETKFDDRLDMQKSEVAATQLEKQKAERAIYKKKRLFEEGESNKVEEQAKLELIMIQKTISAETKVKEEAFNLQTAKIKLDKSRIDAQAKKVAADAQSYENMKLVRSGLTPQQEMEWKYKMHVDGMAKLAGPNGIQLPYNYFGGGAGGGASNSDPLNKIMSLMLLDKVPTGKK